MNDKLDVLPHIVEAVVDHISGPSKIGVAGTYTKAKYLDDRPKTVNIWNKYLASITS